ncbi:hypothetical protein FOZ63_000003 [Perkinsus olseni]|uniref:Succinate dehydrogenase assembly factor 3 n=1 Tax=Perkinsus olseni TaxID=32597 RepID=A0A7J6UHS3_PEROL|nr:hypothetical protein FOZ63_000003 [Perkinsus olseni]KAF4756723.1 hypothetical protein FOZ62_000004 [Perkinsus olseni]
MQNRLLREQSLDLYRKILRLHRTKLPTVMRSLGDAYVKKEFRMHLVQQACSDPQLKQFVAQWEKYYSTISEQEVVKGQRMSTAEKSQLNDAQKKQLKALRVEAKKLGSAV